MSEANPMAELVRISRAPSRVILGLMSGTSLDGIDAAVCEVSGVDAETRVRLRGFETVPFPTALRCAIEAALAGGSPEALCRLNVRLGQAFADAAAVAVAAAGLTMAEVDLIASHGQTIFHVDAASEPDGRGATLQLGEGAEIATRTGVTTVCDFRPGDIAVGGCGAPLVSWVDHLLFAAADRTTFLLNIGGIANLTAVTADPTQAIAYDSGPGNLVIDAVAAALTGGDPPCDLDGGYSARGTVDPEILARLLADPYFQRLPPKTTGREQFGQAYSEHLLAERGETSLVDLLATVVELTATTIADSLRGVIEGPASLIASGGGIHNQTLMSSLEAKLSAQGIALRAWPTEAVGFPPDAKEAVAFALLANQTIQGRPSNLPAATGAERSALLGKIVFPC